MNEMEAHGKAQASKTDDLPDEPQLPPGFDEKQLRNRVITKIDGNYFIGRTVVGPFDVVMMCGRGGNVNMVNKHFAKIIKDHRMIYKNSDLKGKRIIVAAIFQEIKSRQGRFLDSNGKDVATYDRAMVDKKIRHALRGKGQRHPVVEQKDGDDKGPATKAKTTGKPKAPPKTATAKNPNANTMAVPPGFAAARHATQFVVPVTNHPISLPVSLHGRPLEVFTANGTSYAIIPNVVNTNGVVGAHDPNLFARLYQLQESNFSGAATSFPVPTDSANNSARPDGPVRSINVAARIKGESNEDDDEDDDDDYGEEEYDDNGEEEEEQEEGVEDESSSSGGSNEHSANVGNGMERKKRASSTYANHQVRPSSPVRSGIFETVTGVAKMPGRRSGGVPHKEEPPKKKARSTAITTTTTSGSSAGRGRKYKSHAEVSAAAAAGYVAIDPNAGMPKVEHYVKRMAKSKSSVRDEPVKAKSITQFLLSKLEDS